MADNVKKAPNTTPIATVDLDLRISLTETDQVGVVYFANYLAFFEKGSSHFFPGQRDRQ